MDVYWLEQSNADVPLDDDWLSPAEKVCLDAMRFPKRRADWRLGRWTAKRALAACLNTAAGSCSLASIEIRPAASGAPEAFIADRPASVSISLSHSDGNALCVIAARDTALGCDLELIEPRSDAFVADYFTGKEQALIAQAPAADRPLVSTLLWSAKESALKALREGLRLDTRLVTVSLPEAITCVGPDEGTAAQNPGKLRSSQAVWHRLNVGCASGEVFCGWWRQAGHFVRTIVGSPAPNLLIVVKIETVSDSAA